MSGELIVNGDFSQNLSVGWTLPTPPLTPPPIRVTDFFKSPPASVLLEVGIPFSPGTIGQTITTIVGKTYDLVFYGANPDTIFNGMVTVALGTIFNELNTFTIPRNTQTFISFTASFIATSASTNIYFENTSGEGDKIYLDDISVKAAPIIGTLIVNGDFSDQLNGWSAVSVNLNNIIFNQAPPSAQLVGPGALLQQTISTTPGNTYALSFFVRAEESNGALSVEINNIPISGAIAINPTNIWIQRTFLFNATSTTTNITFFNRSNLLLLSIFLDDISVSIGLGGGVICYSGDSIITCKNKLTGRITDVKARDVIASTHEVYDTKNKKYIPIKYNIISGLTERFMLIKKDALGKNKPTADFYVTSGHVLLINGKEIKARDIQCAKRVKVESEKVYSICTENSQPILVNGLDVMTWAEKKWLDYAIKKHLVWEDNEPEQKTNAVLKKLSVSNSFVKPKKHISCKQYCIYKNCQGKS